MVPRVALALVWLLAGLLAALLPACASLPEPDNANARNFTGYQPLCILLCFSTGEATQSEGPGAARGGGVITKRSTHIGTKPRPVVPVVPVVPVEPIQGGKP